MDGGVLEWGSPQRHGKHNSLANPYSAACLTPAVWRADMLRWVLPDHPTLQCALREHGRLVAQCEKEGLRKLHLDLQIHHQRLQDVVHEAKAGLDG
jgi:hypothetical protein